DRTPAAPPRGGPGPRPDGAAGPAPRAVPGARPGPGEGPRAPAGARKGSGQPRTARPSPDLPVTFRRGQGRMAGTPPSHPHGEAGGPPIRWRELSGRARPGVTATCQAHESVGRTGVGCRHLSRRGAPQPPAHRARDDGEGGSRSDGRPQRTAPAGGRRRTPATPRPGPDPRRRGRTQRPVRPVPQPDRERAGAPQPELPGEGRRRPAHHGGGTPRRRRPRVQRRRRARRGHRYAVGAAGPLPGPGPPPDARLRIHRRPRRRTRIPVPQRPVDVRGGRCRGDRGGGPRLPPGPRRHPVPDRRRPAPLAGHRRGDAARRRRRGRAHRGRPRQAAPVSAPRVVSLVPSLTEAVALSAPGALVGATDWCSHPAGLDVERIGGTKNPKVDRIVGLAPDLVVANEEENREPDLAALRAAGLTVLVTEVRTLP